MFRASFANPRSIVLAAAAILLAAAGARAAEPPERGAPSIAFHYGAELPVDALSWFDEIVVDPRRARPADVAALRARGAVVLARATARGGKALAINTASWMAAGYGGLYLEDLDALSSSEAMAAVTAAREAAPGARLYGHGAPEPLAWFQRALTGVVVDSRLTRLDAKTGRPRPTTAAERTYGERWLEALRGRAGGRIVVVEHTADRATARRLARWLADRGLTPWIAPSPALDAMGVGLREPQPRRILALYDGAEGSFLPLVLVHHLAALPIETLGYSLDYVDVRAGLPEGDLPARYAGVVTWFTDDDLAGADRYQRWLTGVLDRGMRVAILGRLGFRAGTSLLARLGMVPAGERLKRPGKIVRASELVGFETPPRPRLRDASPWRAHPGAGVTAHVEIEDAAGRVITPVGTAPWGGWALDPYAIEIGLDERVQWIVDPFAFFRQALALPPLPAPDTTTENGLRLMEVHIDGDGFASRAELPGAPFSGEIVLRDFLIRYPLPTTVSVIEGEVGPAGLYPELSPKLEPLARKIFRLPFVEPASHSYSHPFDWLRAAGKGRQPGEGRSVMDDAVNLPIAGYTYDVNREVGGSVRYIEQRLAPPDRKVRTFLWSGTAMPDGEALAATYALGLANMNGTNSENAQDQPSLAQVPSLGRFVDGHLQVYAPAHNENIYTNEWRGPYYGFRDVIRMFEYTDAPRRLKPISIYYHFYAGTKPASITAMHQIYRWAMDQETLPLWVSEFVARAADFERATLARGVDGTWHLRGFTNLRTVRLDPALGWPDLARSRNVAGVRDLPQGRYVALTGGGDARLALSPAAPEGTPHLVSANAMVASWRLDGDAVTFRLRGHMPVRARLAGCPRLHVVAGRVTAAREGQALKLTSSQKDTGDVTVRCR